MQTHTIAFFSPVRYDSIYQRPQTLFDKLADHGHRMYYFQGPFKKGSLNHSRFSYHFPPAVEHLSETRKIVTVSRYFDLFGFALRFTKAGMDRHVSRWLKGFMDTCMGGRVIAFVETPPWWKYVRDYPFEAVYYDCIDGYPVLGKNFERAEYDALVEDLTSKSRKVFVTAEKLEKNLREWRDEKDVLRVPNGLALEKFENVSSHPEIAELKTKFKKVIGYVGVIHEWTDTELIAHSAAALPDFAFVIVGPYKEMFVPALVDKPNVFLLNERPHDEIPAFIQGFDVCLNPFKMNEVGHDTNPVKLFEYLALGKPVVSTDIHELKNFEGLIHGAGDRDAFVSGLKEAAAEGGDADLQARRRSFARANSWDRRMDRILEAME